MASLVSQTEACWQLRLVEASQTPDQLADVNFKAEQASAIVVDYLKRPFIEGPLVPEQQRRNTKPSQKMGDFGDQAPPDFWPNPGMGWLEPSLPPIPPDPWTPANVPILVKGAILIVLTSLYDGRTPDDVLLSPSITAMLERLRDPAMA